jgi:hypothetical protein
MKYAEAAEELFRQFALRHSLLIDKIEHEFADVMMELPVQHGLTIPIALILSDDELQIVFGEHSGCWYLSDNTATNTMANFEEICDGLIDGGCRVVEYWQFDKPVKTAIEKNRNGKWEAISTRWSPFLLPFFKVRKVIVQNSRAGI